MIFTVFDEVVFRQTLQACSACKTLREYDTDGGSESVPMFRLPLVDVLQKCRERAVLERFLEVLVSFHGPSLFKVQRTHHGEKYLPPDQLVKDLDKLLYLIDLGGGLDLKEGEGRCRALCVEVRAAGLEKAADNEDVEKGVGIFEEFQCRSGLDELVRNCVVITLRDRL